MEDFLTIALSEGTYENNLGLATRALQYLN